MNRKLKNEELGRINVSEFKSAKKNNIILVLDNVRSLHNVGSIFRTADAFLIEEIYLCGYTGTPPHHEIEKTALGATQSIKWTYRNTTIEALNELRQKDYRVLAIEQAKESTLLNQFIYKNEKLALVFGNEVYGVEQEIINICEEVIEIPQSGTKHSLNIAVSVGIVLWEILRGRI